MKAKGTAAGLLVLGLVAFCTVGPGLAQDCTVTVHSGESIQEAIDSASAGCVICLAEGTWEEDLTITIEGLTLRGQGPLQSIVVGSVLVQVTGQFIVEGLTLRSADQLRLEPGEMALIPGGAFQIGDPFNEGDPDERPVRTAIVSAFYIDPFEVTKALWDEVAVWAAESGYDIGPGDGTSTSDANHPVVLISWYEAVKWANARSEKEGLDPCYTVAGDVYRAGQGVPDCNWTATGYRLPTEAEWEKAARGGLVGARYPWGDDIDRTQANYDNSVGSTAPVGSYAANGYGLFDMTGNVYEWCWDWYRTQLSGGADPHGPSSGSNRVSRGGSWASGANACRIASRLDLVPNYESTRLGFRLVRAVS